ncbi:hypothetical protein N9L08_10065, partial [Rhodobacteraceae bacterium]|nr:hypothetical protein [Paracoccaceae bacterium]
MNSVAGTATKNDTPYLILFIGLSISLFLYVYKGKYEFTASYIPRRIGRCENFFLRYLQYGWIFIVFTWLISAFIGVINGNHLPYVFRNFFGLLLYLIVPIFFILKPSLRDVIVTICVAGFCQLIYMTTFLGKVDFAMLLLSFSGTRVIHNPAIIVMYPLLSL